MVHHAALACRSPARLRRCRSVVAEEISTGDEQHRAASLPSRFSRSGVRFTSPPPSSCRSGATPLDERSDAQQKRANRLLTTEHGGREFAARPNLRCVMGNSRFLKLFLVGLIIGIACVSSVTPADAQQAPSDPALRTTCSKLVNFDDRLTEPSGKPTKTAFTSRSDTVALNAIGSELKTLPKALSARRDRAKRGVRQSVRRTTGANSEERSTRQRPSRGSTCSRVLILRVRGCFAS